MPRKTTAPPQAPADEKMTGEEIQQLAKLLKKLEKDDRATGSIYGNYIPAMAVDIRSGLHYLAGLEGVTID